MQLLPSPITLPDGERGVFTIAADATKRAVPLGRGFRELVEDAPDILSRFEVRSGLIVVEGGDGGRVVDVAAARDALLRSAARGDDPIHAELKVVDGPPVLSADEATQLATAANDASANGISVTVTGQTAAIDAETLRSWLRPDVDNRSFVVDTEAAAAELRNRMLGGRTPEQSYDGIAWLYAGM